MTQLGKRKASLRSHQPRSDAFRDIQFFAIIDRMNDRPRRPGDGLLDKYLPDADEVAREAARDAFRKYALLLVRLGTRIYEDMRRTQQADSTGEGSGVIL